MSQTIACTSCNKEFAAADEGAAVWLICPHCGGRSPNPLAFDQRKKLNQPFGILSCFGTLLIVFGTLLLVPGTCGMLLVDSMARGSGGSRTAVVFLGCALAVAGGFVLLRVQKHARQTTGTVTGQALVLAALVALAAVASFMFALVTCFGAK